MAGESDSTGRYNPAQGGAGTATGIGAALSIGISGYAVEQFGYAASFFGLAAAGFVVLYSFLPETKSRQFNLMDRLK